MPVFYIMPILVINIHPQKHLVNSEIESPKGLEAKQVQQLRQYLQTIGKGHDHLGKDYAF